jgi:hypothetical protein
MSAQCWSSTHGLRIIYSVKVKKEAPRFEEIASVEFHI